MRHRPGPDLPTPRFALTPWTIEQAGLHATHADADAALFALANGYLGVRGTTEEGVHAPHAGHAGTYLNAFHETFDIRYPEDAFGLARLGQTLLNLTHATRIDVQLDDDLIRLEDARASEIGRVLDLRAGTLTRRYTWTAHDGARTRVELVRAVSLRHRGRLGQRLRVTPLDRAVRVRLCHHLDARVSNRTAAGDPRVGAGINGQVLQPVAHATTDAGAHVLHHRAPHSGMEVACTANLVARLAGTPTSPVRHLTLDPMHATTTLILDVSPTTLLEVDVHAVFADARHHPAEALMRAVTDELEAWTSAEAFDGLLSEQRADLDAFWHHADIEIEGDPAATQSVRFALFHLYQGAGRDGRTNLPAKALTGEGYEGHTFWDTEIYLLPTLLYLHPELARALLTYRIHLLDAARTRARELGHEGALYPWRTIDGPEASAYFPAGTAQLHINADIVHAFARYLAATEDTSILWDGGAAVATEVARFFMHAGHTGRDGAFHLHTVTGPDEYTALVDDNHYTNRMAQFALRFAADTVDTMRRDDPGRFEALAAALDLAPYEAGAWRAVADVMHLPVDETLAVTPQDASFLGKPEWPWDDTPESQYPLLLHVHPLDIYRHQVLKQADVLLAHYLLPDGVSRSQLRRDAAYYTPRTTHDSSLSPFAHAITAADLGDLDTALDHYLHSARTDLDDLHGNTVDGIHAAAMAGTWLATVEGFGGFRVRQGLPTFHPRLPKGWRRLRFRIVWRGRLLEVDADRATTTYRLLGGEGLRLLHRGERLDLPAGGRVARPTGPRLRGVAFDLDGVLTDSAEYHYQAWKALADELDVPFDRAANEELRGVPRMASLEAILARGSHRFDEATKRALAAKKNVHYQRLIETVTPSDLLPGIRTLLDDLEAEGVRLALASSSRNGPTLLARLGIAERFHVVVDPLSLRRGKPDPEIFETAAELLGLPVEDCVGVEDAQAGIRAIRGANMPSVGVGDATLLEAADVLVPTTKSLTLGTLHAAIERHASGAAR